MRVNLLTGKVESHAHCDEVVFLTDMKGPDGVPVKATVRLGWGQGLAWLEGLKVKSEAKTVKSRS